MKIRWTDAGIFIFCLKSSHSLVRWFLRELSLKLISSLFFRHLWHVCKDTWLSQLVMPTAGPHVTSANHKDKIFFQLYLSSAMTTASHRAFLVHRLCSCSRYVTVDRGNKVLSLFLLCAELIFPGKDNKQITFLCLRCFYNNCAGNKRCFCAGEKENGHKSFTRHFIYQPFSSTNKRSTSLVPKAKVFQCHHHHALLWGGVACQWGEGGLTLVVTWSVADGGGGLKQRSHHS